MSDRKRVRWSKDNKAIRAFHWAWDTYPIDTCRLAWGLIFIWVAVILIFINEVVWERLLVPLGHWIEEHLPEPKARPILSLDEMRAEEERERAKAKKKANRRRNRLDKVLAVVNKLATIWQPIKWAILTPIEWLADHGVFVALAWAVLIGFGLAAIGGIVWLVVNFTIQVLIVLGAVLAFVAIVAGIVFLLVRFENPIKRFFTRLGEVISAGYHSFHNQTCAVVEIEGVNVAPEGEKEIVHA